MGTLIKVIVFLMQWVGLSGKSGDNAAPELSGGPSFTTPGMGWEQKQLPAEEL